MKTEEDYIAEELKAEHEEEERKIAERYMHNSHSVFFLKEFVESELFQNHPDYDKEKNTFMGAEIILIPRETAVKEIEKRSMEL